MLCVFIDGLDCDDPEGLIPCEDCCHYIARFGYPYPWKSGCPEEMNEQSDE